MRKINILAFDFTKRIGLKKLLQTLSILTITICLFSSCNVYKRNIMLQLDEQYQASENNKSSWDTKANYTIQPNDRIIVEVYTNKGERIIDPDFELSRDIGTNQANFKPQLEYLVNDNGEARLPMVDGVLLKDLTLLQAEIKLQESYSKFYEAPYVHVALPLMRK